jgi:hypothetical protein
VACFGLAWAVFELALPWACFALGLLCVVWGYVSCCLGGVLACLALGLPGLFWANFGLVGACGLGLLLAVLSSSGLAGLFWAEAVMC